MSPAAHNSTGGDFTVTSAVPVTSTYPPAADLDRHIKNAGAGRATRAVSKERPEGVEQFSDSQTVLQAHVAFWDRDGDGLIYPQDTYVGFHKLFPASWYRPILSFIAILVVNGSFAYWSQDSWIPSPYFAINMKNMHRTRHGSDTQVYDSEGRFVPQKFEDLFSKYDKDGKGGLTLSEMVHMGTRVRKIMDPVGWSAFAFEWATYYIMAENGYVSKEKIRGCYDGSVFYQIAAENERKEAGKHSKKLA